MASLILSMSLAEMMTASVWLFFSVLPLMVRSSSREIILAAFGAAVEGLAPKRVSSTADFLVCL